MHLNEKANKNWATIDAVPSTNRFQIKLKWHKMYAATEDELAAKAAAAATSQVRPFTRKRPVRKPWPETIERERVVVEAPKACACCGGSRLAKIGEDVTRTLEEIPRRFKLIETVRGVGYRFRAR